MVAQPIEQLKRQFTDKYVKVDASRPELMRFRDLVGQVKTVNMSGRALVEFMDYHLNIGWYDIDLGCLTVVPKPEPKSAEDKKAEAKKPAPPKKAGDGIAGPPAGEKKMSALKMARTQGAGGAAKVPAAKPAAGGEKKSVADILAAARAGKSAAPAEATKPAAAPAAPAAKPAAPAAGGKPSPAPRGKMSVAEMLAAARAGGGGGSAAAPDAKTQAEAAPVEEAPAEAAAPAPSKPAAEVAATAKAAGAPVQRVDKSKMSIAEMIAYCREHDAS
jgi:hypothetical protein